MADATNEVVRPPPPTTALQRFFTMLLPQFIGYSRKGLIWFSSLGASGILELVKSVGSHFNWTDAQTLQWSNRMLLMQGIILLVAKFWTDQIAHEDSALKTGLPPPPVTMVTPTAPSPVTVQVTTTPAPVPPPTPGEGD